MHARFFHNHTSAPHILVKLGHILFAYMSPVIFFFAATKISMNGSITLAGAMSSCIFYIIAANCALLEHGSTTRTIKKVRTEYRVVLEAATIIPNSTWSLASLLAVVLYLQACRI